jgi:glutamate formiminotransferase/formiminotetrahydrofolate cyclodeaminase
MEECVKLAHRLGKRVGEELGVPVYLYEAAATSEQRRSLPDIRSGEYEGLAKKLEDPAWKPDYGPAEFKPRSGAFVIGARKFLIAYNINLNTRDPKLANEIAIEVRERGRLQRDANGNKILGEDGVPLRTRGRLAECKATGWYIEDYGQAQVSMNLTDHHVTPVHLALETVREEAQKRGLVVTGSELVGLMPKDAILEAGKYYLKRQGRSWGVPERELIDIAIASMGLSQLSPFDPNKKIIELSVEKSDGKLVQRSVTEFVDECSSESPAPGGGSVAALSGALGAGLVSMVANLTVGKKGYEQSWEEMKEVAAEAQGIKDHFVVAVDRDTEAFNAVMAGFRMPKGTSDQIAARDAAIEQATKTATLVPFGVLKEVPRALELALVVAEKGNKNSASDAGVAASALRTAAQGAWLNVRINLGNLKDDEFRQQLLEQGTQILRAVQEAADAVQRVVDGNIGG